MKLAPVLIALALALPLPALAGAAAAPDSLARAFGNTVVSTYPDGRTGLLWLKRDGTYAAKGRHRTSSSGTWTLKGEKMCLNQKRPIGVPFAYCTALPTSTTWTAKAVTGEPITVRIVKGIAVS